MPGRPPQVAWRCSRNELSRKAGAVQYAPDVKQWVKIREVLTNGIREREMVSFKLK